MFKIDCTLEFIKKCSRLSKKYPSLKEEVSHLIKSLSDNPKQGDRLKNQCYKIRINIKSKGRGAGWCSIDYPYRISSIEGFDFDHL